jgi:hypothetical protein
MSCTSSSDTPAFLWAITIIMLSTIGATRIVDGVKEYINGPKVVACATTYQFSTHKVTLIGEGELW